MYHKTGSSVVIEDLHKLGNGLSYTETKFVEDKWAEWAENKSTIVPSNIEEKIVVTHVIDNIDWKNKDIHGKETHNTNSILIQQKTLGNEKVPVQLTPNYDFERKSHRALKCFRIQLPNINFVRAKCKQQKSMRYADRTEFDKSSSIN